MKISVNKIFILSECEEKGCSFVENMRLKFSHSYLDGINIKFRSDEVLSFQKLDLIN